MLSDTPLISRVCVPYTRRARLYVLLGLPGFGTDASKASLPSLNSRRKFQVSVCYLVPYSLGGAVSHVQPDELIVCI